MPDNPPPNVYGSHGSFGSSGGYGSQSVYDGQGAYGGHGTYGGQRAYGSSYGSSPFSSLAPSVFTPEMDPGLVAAFRAADLDDSGFIDDRELQQSLSSYHQSFSLRTVHLLMYHFSNSNVRRLGPKEFSSLVHRLQN